MLSIFSIYSVIYAQNKQNRPIYVTSIQAIPLDSNTIELTWTIPEHTNGHTITDFSIFRSTYPIINSTSLSKLESIGKVNGSYISFRDKVPDNSDYYYAIAVNAVEEIDDLSVNSSKLYFDEEYDTIPNDNSTVFLIIVPGENATISPVHAQDKKENNAITRNNSKESSEEKYSKRKVPLPYTNPLTSEQTDTNMQEHKISYEAEEYVLNLINDSEHISKQLEPYIFSEDFITPTGGEAYLLFEILIDSFIKEKYEQAVIQLTQFLAQNRSQTITQKAIFYLGQSLYFTNDYQKAINCFLTVYEAYPNLARKWIDSSLDYIKL